MTFQMGGGGSGGGGGGGTANISILDEGIVLTNTVTSINFVGNGVTGNVTGNAVTVTIATNSQDILSPFLFMGA
jgi:hypothetical protein